MSERHERLMIYIDEAARDLLPARSGPLTTTEREAFGERLAASIRTMSDVYSAEFVPTNDTVYIIRTPEPVIRMPMAIIVIDEEEADAPQEQVTP